MKLRLERFTSGPDSTLGNLFIDDSFACFTCEDEYRAEKVRGKTRIPAGTYQLKLRNIGESRFDQGYRQRFGDMHKGMIELVDVPNFTDILYHIGNKHTDTAGCILPGTIAKSSPYGGGSVQSSTVAYRQTYPLIVAPLLVGESVPIEIIDRDG